MCKFEFLRLSRLPNVCWTWITCPNLGAAAGVYKYHEPVQKPIDPPYKRAMAEKRGEKIENDEKQNENLEEQFSECDINK